MRKQLLFLAAFLPLLSAGQIVKIYVFTNTTPSSVTVNTAAQKYDASKVFMLSMDDNPVEAFQVFQYSKKYSHDDGAGKQIPYRAELAVNHRNAYNCNDLLPENGYTTLSAAQLTECVKGGWSLSNHGAYHFDSTVVNSPGWENACWLPQVENIKQNEQFWYRKTGLLGAPFVMRTWTTPSADQGYNPDAEALGYLASSSQSVTDGYPDIQAGSPITIPTINGSFKVYRRDFSDNWPADWNGRIKGFMQTLAGATSASRKMYRIGSHLGGGSVPYMDTLFKFISTNGTGWWVTNTQEFEEYHEIVRLVGPTKTQSTSGNVTTITFNFSGVPDKNRWRDMSLLVSAAGATIQGVFVSGVDDYSFNGSTGLLNFYSEKRSGYSRPYGAPRVTNTQLPITPDMIVVDAYERTEKRDYWVDGSANNFGLGFGTYATDTVDVWIEFDPYKKRDVKITRFEFWDANGDAINNPAVFYGVKKYGGAVVQLATFNGDDFGAWKTATVSDTSTLAAVFMRKVKVNDNTFSRVVPGKIKIFGDYNLDTIFKPSYIIDRRRTPFKQTIGSNTYWSQVINPNGTNNWQKSVLFPNVVKMQRQRFYFDICQHVSTGDSTWFNYYDSVFKWTYENGVDVSVSLKSMPRHWVEANYPQTINGNQIWPGSESCLNVLVPAPWGSDWKSAESYRKLAEYGWTLSARYGRNKFVDRALMRRKKQMEFFYHNADADTAGLGYMRFISSANEMDKSWIGNFRWLTQSGAELMAMASAFYDGHKNTMGPGVGVKMADPSMVVLSPAYTRAGASDNILRMGAKWVAENRGYRADGVTPDYPFDEYDFHNYDSDAGGQHQQTTGKAHEQAVGFAEVDTVLASLGAWANSMPADMTETGWDTKDTTIGGVRQGTVQNAALNIPGKSVYQVQADWTTRKAILSWARGIRWVDWYELYDNDPVNWWLTLYSSTGLFWQETQGHWSGTPGVVSNKPSGNHLVQIKRLLGNYTVDSVTLRTSDSLWIVRGSYLDSVKYVAWVGKQSGATTTASVPISQGVRYDLSYNSETYSSTPINTGGSAYSFTATETPVVILFGAEGSGGGTGVRYQFKHKKRVIFIY